MTEDVSFEVPTIDISAYVAGDDMDARADVARKLDVACRTVGFMQIVGHGVPTRVTDGLAEAMDLFFGQDLETKKRSTAPAGANRGYSAPKSESLSLSLGVESASRMNDFFEAFNIGDAASLHPGLDLPTSVYAENVWPELDARFETQVLAYYEEARRVAQTMTHIFEDALGLDRGFFEGVTDHSIDVMRMNNYALPEGTVDLDGDLTGMGEHTDFGIVTILWADQVAGLQVLGRDRAWHDVAPADGALLINLGDVTGRWTNDQWMSTLHRVKPPIVNGTIQRRRSAAFFHDGNFDAVITTIPSTVTESTPDLYAPITIGDHIAQKLAGSRQGKLNESATRDAERVKSALY
ncbi:isopenicillin N synthase family dioxygenase [Subtercola frigoramans]|uniref:Isopenicillin N synthase-like dioxygenase n=1 Tax=Subtercola frigoramans TaxID=120298 RepID=A0ABS2L451_9MICO|nr:isopenicillin N synthase family oxygenase [Subtercola frigoramans]MBM7471828.1 isopenicillin N synthase-like dioxygenase [Subtercola frigoramans]